MITPKEQFFDRFDQSFSLLKENFFPLFIPVFIYNILYFIVGYISFLKVSTFGISEFMKKDETMSVFTFLNNSTTVIYIALGTILFLLYLTLYIPLILSLIKSIKQGFAGEKVTMVSNVLYGTNKFISSFSTYYYIFLYVAGIPSVFFIIGGILFNLTYFIELDKIFKDISILLMSIGGFLFIFFSIYRGIKTKFSLLSAVDENKFTKTNFKHSIDYTKNNWWRIAGNIVLIGFLIGIIKSITSSIIGLLGFLNSGIFDILGDKSIEQVLKGGNISAVFSPDNLNKIISTLGEFNIVSFVGEIIKVGINSIELVFLTIFLFIFFKRLELEKKGVEKKNLELINGDEKIEL